MKISKILAYKNLLEANTPIAVSPLVSSKLKPILAAASENSVYCEELANRLTREHREMFRHLGDIECTIEEIKTLLQNTIEQNNHLYFAESLKNYTESVDHETTKFILDRKLVIFKEVIDQILSRIRQYNNWKCIGMILRPGREDWIHDLVGCDPLYLVDTRSELLDPAVLRFNEQYQRRLRTYTINESMTTPMLDNLPKGQFGFCLVYNFFNYKPIELIELYLKELYEKVKPGGVVAFTFNNCDRSEGVELFERHFMSYTPANKIFDICKNIGFEIKNNIILNQSCNWTEVVKPGESVSIKGGQSLAKILYNDYTRSYTAEEQRNIRITAADLNIHPLSVLEEMPLSQIIDLINQRKSQQ